MIKIDKKILSFNLSNYPMEYYIDFPEHSEILDAYLLDDTTIGILYKYSELITNIKSVTFLTCTSDVSSYISDDFSFFKKPKNIIRD